MNRIFLLLTFICFTLTARAALPLEKWEGKYPVNHDPQFQNLFEVPEVKAALGKMLSPAEIKLLTQTYAVTVPIRLFHGYLVVEVFLPHGTPAENAMLVIDLQQQRFHVGFYQHVGHVTIKWVSSEGDVHDLPKEIQDAFYYMHVPQLDGSDPLGPAKAALSTQANK